MILSRRFSKLYLENIWLGVKVGANLTFSQMRSESSERATLRRCIFTTDRAIGFKFGRIVPRVSIAHAAVTKPPPISSHRGCSFRVSCVLYNMSALLRYNSHRQKSVL